MAAVGPPAMDEPAQGVAQLNVCAQCAQLGTRLAKSEEKRQRMKSNLHKFRDRMIDTSKLLDLYNQMKREKEELDKSVQNARRQRAEDRGKIEEAMEQLADKEREVKDLRTVNSRLRAKIDTSVAELTQQHQRALELQKREAQTATQGQQQAEHRARQAASRLQAEQTAVSGLQQQLQMLRNGTATGALTGTSLGPTQLREVASAISSQLVPSVGKAVRTEIMACSPHTADTTVSSSIQALRKDLNGRLDSLATDLQGVRAGPAAEMAPLVLPAAMTELRDEMRQLREEIRTQQHTASSTLQLEVPLCAGEGSNLVAVERSPRRAEGSRNRAVVGDSPAPNQKSVDDGAEESDTESFALELERELSPEYASEVCAATEPTSAGPAANSSTMPRKRKCRQHMNGAKLGTDANALVTSSSSVLASASSGLKSTRAALVEEGALLGTARQQLRRHEFESLLQSRHGDSQLRSVKIGGRDVELHAFYCAVWQLGGMEAASRKRKWAQLCREHDVAPAMCTQLKAQYRKLILPAVLCTGPEHDDGEQASTRTSAARPVHPAKAVRRGGAKATAAAGAPTTLSAAVRRQLVQQILAAKSDQLPARSALAQQLVSSARDAVGSPGVAVIEMSKHVHSTPHQNYGVTENDQHRTLLRLWTSPEVRIALASLREGSAVEVWLEAIQQSIEDTATSADVPSAIESSQLGHIVACLVLISHAVSGHPTEFVPAGDCSPGCCAGLADALMKRLHTQVLSLEAEASRGVASAGEYSPPTMRIVVPKPAY